MDPAVIYTALTAAISTLFGLYVRELQAQNKAKDERIGKLEEKVEKQTEALLKNATSQEQVVEMLRTLLTDRGGA